MIIVTGGAGFIGSNLCLMLSKMGYEEIVVIDDLTNGKKFNNLIGSNITDYVDIQDAFDFLDKHDPKKIEVIFHMGACSDTTEWNGSMMMALNFEFSKKIEFFSRKNNIRFIYASSAAVYGLSKNFNEDNYDLSPLNIYGYSKYLFDRYLNFYKLDKYSAGFRFFNVYGPREEHKGKMSSVVLKAYKQIKENNQINLFDEFGSYGPGEHERDFIYVDDVCNVLIWAFNNINLNGIFNLGTGNPSSFNDLALATIKSIGNGHINYIPFPDELKKSYQEYTCADMSKLNNAGYDTNGFLDIFNGVEKYIEYLNGEEKWPSLIT